MTITQKILEKISVIRFLEDFCKIKVSSTQGNNLLIICSFHNDTNPSLNVDKISGLAKCFSCGTGSDLFGIYCKLKGLNPSEALKTLTSLIGIEKPEKATLANYSLLKKLPIDFLMEKGITETSRGVEFPITDRKGVVVNAHIRKYANPSNDIKDRFIFKEKKAPIYPLGISFLYDINKPEIEITEGQSDWITNSFIQNDRPTVGFFGASNVKLPEGMDLSHVSKIIIHEHADPAGEKFSQRVYQQFKVRKFNGLCQIVQYTKNCKDLSEVWIELNDKEKVINYLIKNTIQFSDANSSDETKRQQIKIINGSIFRLADGRIQKLKLYNKKEQDALALPTDYFYNEVANFNLKILKEIKSKQDGRREIVIEVSIYNDEKVIVKIPSDVWGTRFLLDLLIKEVGSKLHVFDRDAIFALCQFASLGAGKIEQQEERSGGFEPTKETYLIRDIEISEKEIFKHDTSLTNSSEFDKTANFMLELSLSKVQAQLAFINYAELSKQCWGFESAILAIAAPFYIILYNIHSKGNESFRMGLELFGNINEGKTEFSKIIMSFFLKNCQEQNFFKISDTHIGIDRRSHCFNGSAILYNDYKGLSNIRDFQEKLQNRIDQATYTKAFEDRDTISTKKFSGLFIINGQERVARNSTSLQTRLISVNIQKNNNPAAFARISELRSNYNNITPFIIQFCLQKNRLKTFKNNVLDFFHQIVELDNSKSVYSRVHKNHSFFYYSIIYALDFIKESNENLYIKLGYNEQNVRIMILNLIERKLTGVHEDDTVTVLFDIIEQGLQSGAAYLGDKRTQATNSTAIRIGEEPNLEENTVWLHPRSCIQLIKNLKSSDEMFHTQANAVTSELSSRKMLIETVHRKTSRAEPEGDWGWTVNLDTVPRLRDFLRSKKASSSKTQQRRKPL